ncbi:toxin Doc [Streptomyces sp. NPDC059893]|uniref:toxin Doc n=1 Tax=Streptomyces sp. NPDC059893 TaxID=3346990 RepID=UPI00364ED043
MELLVDYRWLPARQEDILRTDPTVNDLSVLVGMAARHRVDPPPLDQSSDPFWRAAVFLEECVLLRPLPARNETYGYGIALAYLEASAEPVDAAYELWNALITEIRSMRLDSHTIAERLRSWRIPTGHASHWRTARAATSSSRRPRL